MTQLNCEEVFFVSRLTRNLSKGRGGRARGVQSEVSGTKEQDGESASHENSVCEMELDVARGMYIGFLLQSTGGDGPLHGQLIKIASDAAILAGGVISMQSSSHLFHRWDSQGALQFLSRLSNCLWGKILLF